MTLDISSIADRTGIRLRRLRYILDHRFVPGLESVRSGHGNARHLDAFQAFVLSIAAALLEHGCPRSIIRRVMTALDGAKTSRKRLSLDQIYRSGASSLTIGNAEAFQLDGEWFVLPTLRRRKAYKPLLLTIVQLDLIRHALGDSNGSVDA